METLVSIAGASDSPAPNGQETGQFPGLRYGELVERRALRQPLRTAIIHDGAHITYGELLGRIHAAAAFLTSQGVRKGDKVVCVSENRPEILTTLYACSRIGAVFTPIGIAAPAADVKFVLRDLSATTILVSERSVPTALEAVGTDTAIRIIQLEAQSRHGLPSLPITSGTDAAEIRPEADSPAIIVYTSGTSGHPKGVVLTHGALFFNGVNTLLGLDIASDDVTLVNTPLSHIAALNTLAVATLHKGGSVVIESKFDATGCLEQISEYGITTMFAVPSTLTLMAQTPGFAEADTSSLRWILGGGAPMPPELVALWSERNVPVLASYGMTEAGPSVSFRRRSDASGKAESSGTPALLTDVRIVSADGTDLPPGETGEILVRGPHTASSYWRDANATDAAFVDGWLITGDRGLIDADGDLCITGRSKEIIITGGENVDPAEIEHLIASYPGVLDAAVIGRPDPLWGEVITAVIVSESTVELKELQEYLWPHLARFKLPRQIERREELPRSPVGKLLRRELRTLLPEHP
jgi:fatty-acyl-CoA synthase